MLQFVKLPEKDIVEMIFFPVVNEACRVLAEGIAVKAADLDIAGCMGMGFPSYRFSTFICCPFLNSIVSQLHLPYFRFFFSRGGVIFWADLLGAKYIYSRLDEWSKMYGGFFKPCAYLAERAAKGIPLVNI